MKKATQKKFSDLLERAAWTFVQAFAAVALVPPVSGGVTPRAAALAAGISALKTFVKETL